MDGGWYICGKNEGTDEPNGKNMRIHIMRKLKDIEENVGIINVETNWEKFMTYIEMRTEKGSIGWIGLDLKEVRVLGERFTKIWEYAQGDLTKKINAGTGDTEQI